MRACVVLLLVAVHFSDGETFIKTSSLSGGFGTNLVLTDNFLLVASSGSRTVHVYHINLYNGAFTLKHALSHPNTESGDQFGMHRMAFNGQFLVVPAHGDDSSGQGINPASQTDNDSLLSGAAYLWRVVGDSWSFKAFIKEPSHSPGDKRAFGWQVAIDSNTMAISALNVDNGAGLVYLYGLDPTQLLTSVVANPRADGDWFGYTMVMSNSHLVVGAPRADRFSIDECGVIFVFRRQSAASWTQVTEITLPRSVMTRDDRFGDHLAMFGTTLAVGGIYQRASDRVDLYTVTSTTISHTQTILPVGLQHTSFGFALALNNDVLAVGDLDSTESGVAGGAVFAYKMTLESTWGLSEILTASNAVPTSSPWGDDFGTSVGVTDRYVCAGAPNEATSNGGINPTPNDELPGAGAVYCYLTADFATPTMPPPTTTTTTTTTVTTTTTSSTSTTSTIISTTSTTTAASTTTSTASTTTTSSSQTTTTTATSTSTSSTSTTITTATTTTTTATTTTTTTTTETTETTTTTITTTTTTTTTTTSDAPAASSMATLAVPAGAGGAFALLLVVLVLLLLLRRKRHEKSAVVAFEDPKDFGIVANPAFQGNSGSANDYDQDSTEAQAKYTIPAAGSSTAAGVGESMQYAALEGHTTYASSSDPADSALGNAEAPYALLSGNQTYMVVPSSASHATYGSSDGVPLALPTGEYSALEGNKLYAETSGPAAYGVNAAAATGLDAPVLYAIPTEDGQGGFGGGSYGGNNAVYDTLSGNGNDVVSSIDAGYNLRDETGVAQRDRLRLGD